MLAPRFYHSSNTLEAVHLQQIMRTLKIVSYEVTNFISLNLIRTCSPTIIPNENPINENKKTFTKSNKIYLVDQCN